MANHCIEIICMDCGLVWCCRCYENFGFKKEVKQFLKKKKEKMKLVSANEKCDNCSSLKTYMN